MILISCPDCDRQYDVTHLDPGSRVLCSCEAVMSVKARRDLAVAGLKCGHCGGKIGLEDDACSYCAAKLTEADKRRNTLCPKCFARIDDDARHCQGCGLSIAPQALTPIPAGTSCPACDGKLLHRALGPTDVIECESCCGLWVEPRSFEAVCRAAEGRGRNLFPEARSQSTVTIERPASTARKRAYVPCITCGELMLQKQFRYATRGSGVIVDFCKDHGVWLDDEELEKIVAFVETAESPPPGAGRVDQTMKHLSGEPTRAARRRRRSRRNERRRRENRTDALEIIGWLGVGLLAELFD